jgi:hypothetical protein
MSENGLLRAAISLICYTDFDAGEFDAGEFSAIPDTSTFTSRFGLKAQSTSKG